MAKRTSLPDLERAEARLRFWIGEENSQRNIQEIIAWERAENQAYLVALRKAAYYAPRQLRFIATVNFVAEAYLALREEATARARRQAVQELEQPLRNNRWTVSRRIGHTGREQLVGAWSSREDAENIFPKNH